MEGLKLCPKCRKDKPATSEFFARDKRSPGGLGSWCKECKSESDRKYREANREKLLERKHKYREANRERLREYQRKYSKVNRERIREYQRRYREANPEKVRERRRESSRKYYETNREKYNEYRRKYDEANPEKVRERGRKWYETNKKNPRLRISSCMRTGIYQSIRSTKNGRSWESLVGYTLEDLMAHFEPQLEPGMTWDNYGIEWHIDHIKPISHFNFTSTEDPEFLECWSLWNLRPLWAAENISRGNRVDEVPLPLLHTMEG